MTEQTTMTQKDRVSASGEFNPSKKAEKIMRDGDILAEDESPTEMLERVASVVVDIEKQFGTETEEALEFADRMLELFMQRKIVPSTPIMTNAGRFDERPLSACSVPPVDLNNDYSEIKEKVDNYHEEGMGTGFALDKADNPMSVLMDLQEIAKTGLERDEQHRPVGNMGIMKANNPAIKEFIKVKHENPEIDWKFNLSVNMSDEFIEAYRNEEKFELRDGEEVDSGGLMDLIVKCAWDCADPGLIFLDNMNRRRPFNEELNYVSVAPCGEVGLAEGETCQFASINIAGFSNGESIDWDALEEASKLITRFLDDVLEYSLNHYSHEESVEAMRKSRKIGIGYCGYSKLLSKHGLEYDSEEGNQLLKDTLSFINYHSKKYSVELSGQRGNFEGWSSSKYADEGRNFLTGKFGDKKSRKITEADWRGLDKMIEKHGLRNSTTVILPPTGRSAMTFDTSQQIEPIFSLIDRYGDVNDEFREALEKHRDVDAEEVIEKVRENGSCQELDIPQEIKDVFRTAIEIGHREHFNVLVEAQAFVDESVSKTINLPKDVDPEAVKDVYLKAYDAGLNGMTVYRNGSNQDQPMDLKDED
ncbi:MAG: ribonucleoside-diphosphate reductase alpha chain [Candidatus Nanohaloarchaea archaeon]|jgi:ribonucleoside-diphosphate reductase alpha chain